MNLIVYLTCTFLFKTVLAQDIQITQIDITDLDEDINKIQQIDDFGSQLFINHNLNFYDVIFNLNEAQQARQFFSELISKYSLKPKNEKILSDSDLLSQIKFQEDTNSKKCLQCSKQFSNQPAVFYHLIREHIQFYIFMNESNKQTAQYYFIDKLCKFIDCSRDKDLNTSQDASRAQKRLAHCINFMIENMQQQNQSEDQFQKQILLICKDISLKDPSEIIGKSQTTFLRIVWLIIFWIGIFMSISYYSVLIITEEGRRAWLTRIEDVK